MDITNEFIKTYNPKKVVDQGDIMKIRNKLAHILVKIAPEFYGTYITYENGKAVIYLEWLKPLYGMLILIITIIPKIEEVSGSHWL